MDHNEKHSVSVDEQAFQVMETSVESIDGASIFVRYTAPDNPRGVILFIHGYGDHSGRYTHVLKHLSDSGFATVAPDHRGHGKTAALMGYVERLDAIVDDLFLLRELAAQRFPEVPVFLMGHSMGGLLAILHMQRYQVGIAGAILMAPAVLVPKDIPGIMVALSGFFSFLSPRLPVQPFFDVSKATRLPEMQEELGADPLVYKGRIRARTGYEMLWGMRRALAGLHRITVPILVLHGGDDMRVAPEATDLVFEGVSSPDKEKHVFPEAYHELMHDPDTDHVLAVVRQWLERRDVLNG